MNTEINEYFATAHIADGACIGCGYCCVKTKCDAGVRLYSEITPCPALLWDGERHVCKLMQLPGTLGDSYKEQLHAGAGCCSNLNNWRRETLVNRVPPKIEVPDNPIPPIMQKFIKALGKQFISGDAIMLALLQFGEMLEKEGMGKEQVALVQKKCMQYFKDNRSTFDEGFMG